ncbi:MAG TPA: UDP-N-acetylmuramate--L-alanine ligase, partial [Gammaproteobacteria bacterium]|nr:UDP-N-acetylmuramate--L-alanine ligase [Gammaproteobacteria bacterium]
MYVLPSLGDYKHIHFVGIGGCGMGGIAEVLLNQGYQVTGSDTADNNMVRRLKDLGATVYPDHQAKYIVGVDVVVVSSAIPIDNPEWLAAKQDYVPVLQRAQMLSVLMQSYTGIAISGTHGKTTTTSLIASVLAGAGLDPTYVIGGLLKSNGRHAQLGSGQYFVAEADESDGSFLCLHPQLSVITNIEADHLSTYGGKFERLCDAFLEFISNLPDAGKAIVCLDDPVISDLLPQMQRPLITYGFSERADWQARHFVQHGIRSQFEVRFKKSPWQAVVLQLAGKHNVLNALAAFAVAHELNIKHEQILPALANFAGVGRRFHIRGQLTLVHGQALIIDDYGHHPREIAVTLEAAKNAWPGRRVVLVYQPHRYSRTQQLFQGFVEELAKADKLVLLEIYSAGED